MKPKIWVASLAVIATVGIVIAAFFVFNRNMNPTDAPPSSENSDLKTLLEETYGNLKGALERKNYQETLIFLDPAKDRPFPSEAEFEKAAEFVGATFPNLAEAKFIKVEERGDWAGYYIQNELDDPSYTTVTLIKFHNIAGTWKVSGDLYSSSWSNANAPHSIEEELKTNARFVLP